MTATASPHASHATAPVPAAPRHVISQFLQQVQQRADQIAAQDERGTLTYSQLEAHSAAVAHTLRRLGVRQDDCVALLCEPSITLMTALWGVLRSGGAYLPLAPEYPEDRLTYMVEDSQAKVVLCTARTHEQARQLVGSATAIICLDDLPSTIESASPTDAAPESVADHSLAYVIYTSGTTGRPKGVMIEHHSLSNQMDWLGRTLCLSGARVLQKTPLSFDAAQWEVLAVCQGATVVMGPHGIHRDPEHLIHTVQQHQISVLQCVPTLLQALVGFDAFGTCTNLKYVCSGGEALTVKLARTVTELLPGARLLNLYGPTECTINSSGHWVTPADLAQDAATVSIGTPIQGLQYHLLNTERHPVGQGETGTLYISGPGLARGYLKQPDLTAQKFVVIQDAETGRELRAYNSGDLARWNTDGTVQYVGRADHQVKLRGHRIELDEVRCAVERHPWVKQCGALVLNDPRTSQPHLLAYVELNPREAALMDQESAGTHHMTKTDKTQVMAQLSGGGLRESRDAAPTHRVPLPGRTASESATEEVFARKTYRFFEGAPVDCSDLTAFLRSAMWPDRPAGTGRPTFEQLGEILRLFGPFFSAERLLPKYGYASPGALNATQMYLELHGLYDLPAGHYYFHPVDHELVRVADLSEEATPTLRIHFIGHRAAIHNVYKQNVREVLEMEAGHMIGHLECTLGRLHLPVSTAPYTPEVLQAVGAASDDEYLGSVTLGGDALPAPGATTEVFVQAHGECIRDLPHGLYHLKGRHLHLVTTDVIRRKDVIAINQSTYDRAAFGVTLVSTTADPHGRFIDLGRALHHLQVNPAFGLMSSGYSSASGHDLPSARRFTDLLGQRLGHTYFALGGPVSSDQRRHRGMNEDAVHMKGPAETIRDDLKQFLPDAMLPNQVIVLPRLPVTANGKVDTQALARTERPFASRPYLAPSSEQETQLRTLWQEALGQPDLSITDHFFELGGNSLLAVMLINRVNRHWGLTLPFQAIFTAPTIQQMARLLTQDGRTPVTRLIPLQTEGAGTPLFMWPGLGGYCMNLRPLAQKFRGERSVYGLQAQGINPGEQPLDTLEAMAHLDARLILGTQPEGPYRLWGYSFGARVAFETAWQLEQAGHTVQHLTLVAPGSPQVGGAEQHRDATFANPTFRSILYSVFFGQLPTPETEQQLAPIHSAELFTAYVNAHKPELDPTLIIRVVQIVTLTYGFTFDPGDLRQRTLRCPVTILNARGDNPHFLQGWTGARNLLSEFTLKWDHYRILRELHPDNAQRPRADIIVTEGINA